MTRTTRRKRRKVSSAEAEYLTGQLLIAMPGMRDIRFKQSVVYICAHSAEGAMGIVVNKALDSLTMPDLMAHLEIPAGSDVRTGKVHFGGPVETARGFVLHSSDYIEEGTLVIGDNFALTTTLDVLRAIGRGEGPMKTLLALGYANWSPGQLDSEIHANVWLHAPADDGIVFDATDDAKWEAAIRRIGIELSMLSIEAGHA